MTVPLDEEDAPTMRATDAPQRSSDEDPVVSVIGVGEGLNGDGDRLEAADSADTSDDDMIEMVPLVPEEEEGGGPVGGGGLKKKGRRSKMDRIGALLLPASPLPPHARAHREKSRKRHAHADTDSEPSEGGASESSSSAAVPPKKGTATQRQVAVNIFISFVGAGMLGMPYAFSRSGWALGSAALASVSTANVYSMLLLVKIRKRLEERGHAGIAGYGDLGRVVVGPPGEAFVNVCLVISQVGFATAYIIFIAANFLQNFGTPRAIVCFACVPVLAGLVQVRDMKFLSPFSLVADGANLVGLSSVLFEDFEFYTHGETLVAADLSALLYVASVSIYSLEGVALVLPLETSAADRDGFPSLLKRVILGITLLMILFGCSGYAAFGSHTQAPITLNLEGSWVATFVKLALCLALYLTYPIMMFPVNDVIENNILPVSAPRPNRPFRAGVVLLTAAIAYSVPDFGKFLGLVGASICMLLGFIIPCCFHLLVFGRDGLKCWEQVLDVSLIMVGTVFGVMGTYDSLKSLLSD